MDNDHGKGVIKDNAYAALVTSKTFKSKIELPKKGKGAKYSRKSKHKGSSNGEPFLLCISLKNLYVYIKRRLAV